MQGMNMGDQRTSENGLKVPDTRNQFCGDFGDEQGVHHFRQNGSEYQKWMLGNDDFNILIYF
jgi:hypothetical protein